jgi:hypothetical protein
MRTPVDELRTRMSNREFVEWSVWHQRRIQKEERETRKRR